MGERPLEKERVVEGICRLQKIASGLDEHRRAELDPVISLLEDAAGPTLSRSELGRLLGVSHTTIGRWIEKGDIPTVPTPRGRKEISVGQAVRLLQSVNELTGVPRDLALGQVIRGQRRQATDLDLTRLLPARATSDANGHRKAELRSLAYHRVVARRLNKQVLADARRRVDRWHREGRIHPTWAGEWQRVLAKSEPQIARVLSSDSEHSRALRQSSPFAGALTEHERRRVLEHVEVVDE